MRYNKGISDKKYNIVMKKLMTQEQAASFLIHMRNYERFIDTENKVFYINPKNINKEKPKTFDQLFEEFLKK
jgi:hypothetical protein